MYAVFAFLSRVVLKRLNCVQKEKFRKVERSSKIVVKAQADIKNMPLAIVREIIENDLHKTRP